MTLNPRYSTSSLAAMLVMVCVAGCGEEKTQIDGDLAFVDVAVIPMDEERVLRNMTVVIDDGLIASITPTATTEPAADVRIIDASNRYLIPGLADMHVHIWNQHEPKLYTAYGVTTVRNMWGESMTLELRDKIRAGDIVGPRIFTAGRIVDGAPRVWPGSDEVADAATARAVVEQQVSKGFDFIKVYSNLERPAFYAIVEAAKEAGIGFAGHTPIAVGLQDMLRAGPQSIEHLTGWNVATKRDDMDLGSGYRSPELIAVGHRIASGELSLDDVFDPAKRREMAALSAESGVWNVPTLIVKKTITLTREQAKSEFQRTEMAYVSPSTRDFWNPDSDFRKKDRSDEDLLAMQVYFDESLRDVKALYDAGAPLLIGTDSTNPFVFHGLSVHEELELFVEAGIPAFAALEAATAAPARFFNMEGGWGVVAPGASADLVLLRANPLDDISNTRQIDGVMQQGTWRDREQLDQLLNEVAEEFSVPKKVSGKQEAPVGKLSIPTDMESGVTGHEH